MDKALEFFIYNYSDIRAVLDLNAYVEQRLPQEITKWLYDLLRENFRNWNWGARRSDRLREWKGSSEFCWYDARWMNSEEQKGVFFGIYNISVRSLIEPDEGPFLYLYHDARVRGMTVEALAFAIAEAKIDSNKLGVSTNLQQDGRGAYLIKQPLGDVVTIQKLTNRAAMAAAFINRAQGFTETLAPIVYRVANLM